MNTAEQTAFEKANQAVHPVEKQWHYPIMTKHGYVPDTKEGIGFVRAYHYTHPETKHTMKVVTGASADYWEDNAHANGFGYWADLDPHLTKLAAQ